MEVSARSCFILHLATHTRKCGSVLTQLGPSLIDPHSLSYLCEVSLHFNFSSHRLACQCPFHTTMTRLPLQTAHELVFPPEFGKFGYSPIPEAHQHPQQNSV